METNKKWPALSDLEATFPHLTVIYTALSDYKFREGIARVELSVQLSAHTPVEKSNSKQQVSKRQSSGKSVRAGFK